MSPDRNHSATTRLFSAEKTLVPSAGQCPRPKLSCPKLELLYFDVAGKGEAIRLACSYARLPFRDIRLTQEAFREKKESGELPLGQVPALRVNDETVVVQSNAILRYVAKLAPDSGLYPSDPLTAAKVLLCMSAA